MLKRNDVRTRGELLRDELNQTADHAMRAAGHAAGGAGAALRPRIAAARERLAPTTDKVRDAAVRGWGSTRSAFAPLTEAAQAKVKDVRAAGRKKAGTGRSRWPVLAGLLAGGAAVGALGALLLRRRRQRWEGYQPDEALDSPAAGEPTVAETAAGEMAADEATTSETAASETAASETAAPAPAPPGDPDATTTPESAKAATS